MSKDQFNSATDKKNEANAVQTTSSKDDTPFASVDSEKAITSSTISSTKKSNTTFWKRFRAYFLGEVYQLSKAERGYVKKHLPLAIPPLLLCLLGFTQLPQSIPLLNFAREHRVASPVIGVVLVLLFVVSMIIPSLPKPKQIDDGNPLRQSADRRIRPWIVATGMSTASFVLSLVLLLIVFIRPVWCPSTLCLAPQQSLIYGPHDANFEVDFTAIQSPTYVLTKDPSRYSLNSSSLPSSDDQSSIGAIRIDVQKTNSFYLVALNMHNLRSQGFSMIIEEVALVVRQTLSIPYPLNVLSQPPSQVYQSDNLYSVAYQGEETNAIVPAIYVRLPGEHVQMKPLETDSLLLQVIPHIAVATNIRFSIQITYRIANESQRHIFIPPYVFEIVFAKASNWIPYQLQGGQLVKVKI